jgi:hypothetical protein
MLNRGAGRDNRHLRFSMFRHEHRNPDGLELKGSGGWSADLRRPQRQQSKLCKKSPREPRVPERASDPAAPPSGQSATGALSTAIEDVEPTKAPDLEKGGAATGRQEGVSTAAWPPGR